MEGVFAICVIYGVCLVLHKLIPVRGLVSGYCCDQSTFRPLMYKLNGLSILSIVLGCFLLLPLKTQAVLYNDYWYSLSAANILGITLSLAMFLVGGNEKYTRCLTIDQVVDGRPMSGLPLSIDQKSRKSALQIFYLGCQWNPRYVDVDCKMMLYVFGAVGLACNLLSCVAEHRIFAELEGIAMTKAMLLYNLMFFWFIAEYMYYEHVHIYTYDLFAEKVGFKLIWGCLVFYPYFYAIGSFSLVHTAYGDDLSVTSCVLIFAIFLLGWVITRGANLQKFAFRTNPNKTEFSFLMGLISVTQVTLPSSHILVSGWWGKARHFNYCGEILQGIALALPGFLMGETFKYKFLPWLYPLYYVILFITRQIDDDVVCAMKYGEKWSQYCDKVPWRIIPGVCIWMKGLLRVLLASSAVVALSWVHTALQIIHHSS